MLDFDDWLGPAGVSSRARLSPGCKNLAAGNGRISVRYSRLGRAWPVGLEPTDWFRGHPRLPAPPNKGVDARIKSAQDDFEAIYASITQ